MENKSDDSPSGFVREWDTTLETSHGVLKAIYHPAKPDAESATLGVVYLSGTHIECPVMEGIYAPLCATLQEQGISGLRVFPREAGQLTNCVLDALLGVEFLKRHGAQRVALVGHAFGGAVAITAGSRSEDVVAVAALCTQIPAPECIYELASRPVLLVHGQSDEILSYLCSHHVYAHAQEPKELVILPETGHDLAESRSETLDRLSDWLTSPLMA